jgi:hypothetical protein
MAKNIRKLAHKLGAEVVGPAPDAGGGAFGAARLAQVFQSRLSPSQGRRPGRPTDASWEHRAKVPMSESTRKKLEKLARQSSSATRKVSPMHLAGMLLESALAEYENTVERE